MGLLGKVFGEKVDVPDFKKVDADEVQGKAIAGNTANFAAASGLVGQANEFDQAQLDAALEKAIPGYSQIKAQAGKNINSQLKGELPDDVLDFIQNKSAERAFAGGTAGSTFARKTTARDFGLNSLQVAQQGLQSAMNWMQTARNTSVAPQTSVTSMFIDPVTRLNHEVSERDKELDRDFAQAKMDAAPNPAANALGSLAISAAGSFMGGFGGGFGKVLGKGLGSKILG